MTFKPNRYRYDRRHFRDISRILGEHDDGTDEHERLVGAFAKLLGEHNPNFDPVEFVRRALPQDKEAQHARDE